MRIVLFLISLTLFILALPLYAQEYFEQTVTASELHNSFKKTGKLDFKRTSSLSFKTPGYLQTLSVDEGDYFKEGQILASLDTAELVADKNAKYAQLLNAKRNVNRIKKLIDSNLSSEQALDDANTMVEAARAAYQVAYYNLEKSQIVAPFSGVVISRLSEVNELQRSGQPALVVAASDNNWVVKVALTSKEISRVKKHQKVTVLVHGIGWIDAVVSKVPVKSNNLSNLFDVEVLLTDLGVNVRLISGQIAQVKFEFSEDKLVLKLPMQGLMEINENGKANFLIAANSKKYNVQSFEIIKLDSRFVYISANNTTTQLNVVTQGWQHFKSEL